MKIITNIVVLCLLSVTMIDVEGYSFGMTPRRSTMTMKRARGSYKKEMLGDDTSSGGKGIGSSSSIGGGGAVSSKKNWNVIPNSSPKDLPTKSGQVVLLDTMASALTNSATNPSGAVAVVKHNDDIYCTSVNCPSCKIPLTKAKVLEPNEETGNSAPRLSCDFCKSTYNLKNGDKLESQKSSGIFSGIAKAVLSASDSGPLPVYALGEKDGNLLISFDK